MERLILVELHGVADNESESESDGIEETAFTCSASNTSR